MWRWQYQPVCDNSSIGQGGPYPSQRRQRIRKVGGTFSERPHLRRQCAAYFGVPAMQLVGDG
jgi:hypothetical protein